MEDPRRPPPPPHDLRLKPLNELRLALKCKYVSSVMFSSMEEICKTCEKRRSCRKKVKKEKTEQRTKKKKTYH